ncbi:GTP cyclohydrolase II [Neorhizobium huautlense]|uniref:GTP cyclohydrolase-2 n=1 Tax=Neorhizobium huautlense TaxID=67774 RepID=A0ABT9PQ12_9HYPH|nr:GTP cyclohydrolase II RibA [Neorhizobium huautlense]MDP9836271.1 GTP cyclohydrolase II [Neorhizobium huautlense]
MFQPSSASFFSADDRSQIACERAISEMRYGRPVVIEGQDITYAVLALDTATPETFHRFAALANGEHTLFVTHARSAVLDIDAPSGLFFSIDGFAYEETTELAYGRGAERLPEWLLASRQGEMFERLARAALLLPAFVCLAIKSADGRFDGCARLAADTFDHTPAAEADFAIVARTRVPLKGIEAAEFVVFRGGVAQRDQVAIVVGTPDLSRPVPVRIHSSCLTGDLFGSLKCDCGDQLREGLLLLEQRGGGMLLYLDQEGRGTGIAAKMRAYGYQHQGLDTVDADAVLGFEEDGRRYDAAVAMLVALGVGSVELLTNNPRKLKALEAAGFTVHRRTPVMGVVTAENRNYLATKARRSGHLLDVDTMRQAAE